MKTICSNKKVGFEYFILEKYEAGIKLTGTEIKSIRAGKCNINDAYVLIKNNKPYIVNMNIAKYDKGNIFNHDEFRTRELLLHKHEAVKLATKVKLEGLALVALQAYFQAAPHKQVRWWRERLFRQAKCELLPWKLPLFWLPQAY